MLVATHVETPIGTLRIVGREQDGREIVHGIGLPAGRPEARWEQVETRDEALPGVRRQLREYFAGERTTFELDLAEEGTAFQKTVWRALRRIPYGSTWSYADLAEAIGRPSAVRAVGAANGRNPIPIVVPCHRVIGADGSLTGFGGGLEAKRHLLELEGALPREQVGLGF